METILIDRCKLRILPQTSNYISGILLVVNKVDKKLIFDKLIKNKKKLKNNLSFIKNYFLIFYFDIPEKDKNLCIVRIFDKSCLSYIDLFFKRIFSEFKDKIKISTIYVFEIESKIIRINLSIFNFDKLKNNLINDKLLKKFLNYNYGENLKRENLNTGFKSHINSIKFKIEDNTLDFLKSLPLEKGIVCDKNNNCNQHEVSGELNIKNIEDNVFLLSKGIYNNGDKESTGTIDTKFGYHTHPLQAYKKYDNSLAWPSGDDYNTFLYTILKNDNYTSSTLFSQLETVPSCHLVITIEGIYILSLNEIDRGKIKKVFNTGKVIELYDIEKPKGISTIIKPEEINLNENLILDNYIKYINNIKIKNLSVIHIQFYTWDNLKGRCINIKCNNIIYDIIE